MRRVLPMLLVALVFACACEPESPPVLPAPLILSITPQAQTAIESKTVTVQLDTDPRFLVNYGDRSVQQLDRPTLRIGPQSVPLDTYLGHGQYQGTVAEGLEAGIYDIQVTLPDGREASLAQAYEVKAALNYWFESIDNQLQGVPFLVTLHVTGTNAQQYAGSVTVSVLKNELDGSNPTIQTTTCGPFSNATCRTRLTINTPGALFILHAADDNPNNSPANSNAFRVDTKN
jgi:hypothetical protein